MPLILRNLEMYWWVWKNFTIKTRRKRIVIYFIKWSDFIIFQEIIIIRERSGTMKFIWIDLRQNLIMKNLGMNFWRNIRKEFGEKMIKIYLQIRYFIVKFSKGKEKKSKQRDSFLESSRWWNGVMYFCWRRSWSFTLSLFIEVGCDGIPRYRYRVSQFLMYLKRCIWQRMHKLRWYHEFITFVLKIRNLGGESFFASN